MLKPTLELEQKDVNPDDYLEAKANNLQVESQSQQPSAAALTTRSHFRHQEQNLSLASWKLPFGAVNNNNSSSSSNNNNNNNGSTHQFPQIKLKRRFWDKENSDFVENATTSLLQEQEEEEEQPVRKRTFRELLDERFHNRQKEDTKSSKPRKRKHCLSLATAEQFREKKKQKTDNGVSEQLIQCSPPVFEEENTDPKESQELVDQSEVVSQTNSSSGKRSSQSINWDLVEAFIEEEEEEEQEETTKSTEQQASSFDLDSFIATRTNSCPPRTYNGCSSSRLSLSKNFQQQQAANRESNSNSSVCYRKEEHRHHREAQCAKPKDAGEDDMSIHHQQHYHLPCTSVNSNTTSFPEVASTTSILLLAAAAEESSKMSGHAHYTRSKPNTMQGRFTLNSGTDMALAASLNELPRSKVNSLQGRVDTGTATELAIAQSLSEEQQNILAAVSSTPVAAPVVVNLNTPVTSATIVAAANMNNSLATLCNIGNSCYLNSVLYTLRFAPNFIHNLHHLIEDTDSVYQRLSQNKLKSSSLGRNIPGLHGSSGRSWSSKDLASLGVSNTANNSSSSTTQSQSGANTAAGVTVANGTVALPVAREENLPPKSNRQVVTEQLHELFQNLHRNEAIETMEPFHAGNILRAVQDVSATFEGNQQQDAHEFLMCVLDSIRESCQALIKTITDHPDVLINACPPVPESIETFVPETKSSRGNYFFRRRRDASKPTKSINGGGGVASTLPKTGGSILGGGGDGSKTTTTTTTAADQVAHLKNALFAKPSAALDQQLVRERVHALGLDFFRDDFEGVTVSKTKCLACETCTEQKETMIDIAIPIAASEVSDAAKNPQLFYQNSCITREYFRGDNKYRCEVCCGYREAIRSISFEVLPRQLILQLKRFNGDMEKINSYIPTPFVLRCFCNTCLPKSDCDKPHIYRLYSVITHVGARMSVGHYIAYTSSLDVHAEFLGCGKDRRRQLFLSGGSIDGGGGGSAGSLASTGAGTTGKGTSEKSTSGQLKKLFSSKKASSAGDISKKFKNNVVNKLNLINGIESLNLNNGTSSGSAHGGNNLASFRSQSGSNSPSSNGTPTASLPNRIPCGGLNCCGIHLKNSHLNLYGNNNNNNNNNSNSSSNNSTGSAGGLTATNGTLLDGGSAGDIHTNCINSSSLLGTIGGNGISITTPAAFEQSLSQQLWHMCDDDKIKIMSQTEFEELLSPNRRHVVTPYLLFYARYDLVQGNRPKDTVADCGETINYASECCVDGLTIND
ncbi:uncharacterized protein LOC131426102 [Malaya genurostris]|uniref:uncharacterized protein LOC131426102 n=1 Tax=Malaya genurostris TaxID=325434 RepID=UPI0026F3EB1D|nr:uncharacterized protein LOC131426102 [Malaya genurostris]XP_058444530.1 uncharacterized protein LOC131426102 [Malaya genurostris]XP_058444531.1 uncharacterized protein LOC131426102 [Malaya genurostris]